jgi:hypothetical protein
MAEVAAKGNGEIDGTLPGEGSAAAGGVTAAGRLIGVRIDQLLPGALPAAARAALRSATKSR